MPLSSNSPFLKIMDTFLDILKALGIGIAIGLSLFFKKLIGKLTEKNDKEIEIEIETEKPETIIYDEIHLKPNSSYIKQVEINARMNINFESVLRPNNSLDIYNAVIEHIKDAKERNLESVKVDFPQDVFLNSSICTSLINVCEYIRDHNGIRLVIMIPEKSESANKFKLKLERIIDKWDSGRIEIYTKHEKKFKEAMI